MNDNIDKTLSTFVRGLYDQQKHRVGFGNRMCAQFRAKLGLSPSDKEEEDKDAAEILGQLRDAHKKITDGVKAELPAARYFKAEGVIHNYTELVLVDHYLRMERTEEQGFRKLEYMLRGIPIFDEFLKGVKGCGPAISAVLVTELDIRKARNISSFWAYAGLDVGEDGAGRSRRKEHLVRRKYLDKNGKEAERDSITFNPLLKTKLYVLATCFIKCGSPYADIYRDHKRRLENHPRWGIANEQNLIAERSVKGKKYSPGKHRHNRAMRYMLKVFLADLWLAWRKLEGLPITEPYAVAKLGMRPHAAA